MKQTKVIAFFLPQFHETKENNEWWGKGYTEWVCIKRFAKKAEDKYIPRLPKDDNYYNLLNKSAWEWQNNIAQKYGIDGFAIYHYWMNGKLLLNEPVEKLLQWKDISQPFFLFWANHSWYKANKTKKKILMEQEYGGVDDWKLHYRYMRDFFTDDRYIKVNNKPVIGIFSPSAIPDMGAMIDYWNVKAREDGFDGVYIIESSKDYNQGIVCEKSSAVLWRQSDISKAMYEKDNNRSFYGLLKKGINKIRKIFGNPKVSVMDYSRIVEYEKMALSVKCKDKHFYSISSGWNNMPRHGNYGSVIVGFTPKMFGELFDKLFCKSCKNENEFIFINAWNEWAEGMTIEPDTVYGYGLLEEIKAVKEK